MKIIHLLAVVAIIFSCSAKTPEAPSVAATTAPATVVGDSIPFPVYMSYGEFEPHLQQSNDTTYVVNFWATWCQPCVQELPFFEKLITATAAPEWADKPVKVLLVSMDFPKDIQRKLVPFVAKRNLQRHVVALGDLDYDKWIGKVSEEWDGAIPFTLIYNKKERLAKSGELSGYEELVKLVEEI